jgi:hypothetical protein
MTKLRVLHHAIFALSFNFCRTISRILAWVCLGRPTRINHCYPLRLALSNRQIRIAHASEKCPALLLKSIFIALPAAIFRNLCFIAARARSTLAATWNPSEWSGPVANYHTAPDANPTLAHYLISFLHLDTPQRSR